MKNTVKLIFVSVFALGALFIFLSGTSLSTTNAAVFSGLFAQPTPPKNTNTKSPEANSKPTSVNAAANVAVNSNSVKAVPAATGTPSTTAANTVPASGGKTISKTFKLGLDSQSEYGEAFFDHDSHAFKNYSPDGKSVVGCVECHHTDQPKSALQAPYVTSERDVVLTLDAWQKSSQKVSSCRDCHFQDGNVPDGKTMPTANKKDLNNQLAYHINCNSCHDAAYKLRPELKSRKGFATAKDCAVCHKVD
ncbi:MAG: cytochrome c3 family protein [Chloracidobacterium sp.]|nr:cytochrome c3 family protein [Chloracidobacterium sp.]